MNSHSTPAAPKSDSTLTEVESGKTIRCVGAPPCSSKTSGVPLRISASILPTASLAQRSTTAVTGGSAAAAAGQQRIEREELISDVIRMRTLGVLGIVVWCGFALLDVFVASSIGWHTLEYFMAIRVVGLAIIIPIVLEFHAKRPLTRRYLTLLDVTVFSAIVALIALMCLVYGGISSRYMAGVMVATIARGSVLAAHWRRGLMLLGAPLLAFPVALGIAAPFDQELVAQFLDRGALSDLTLNLFMLLSTLGVCVAGGHNNWSVRRQLFASRSIGKYSLKRCIGRGGMGEVWVAYHPGLHRDVALKILHTDHDGDPVAVRRFEQEVAATSLLTHPNTVRIFDYGVTEDGIWYYAMELLDGETLDVVVARDGALDASRALKIAHQVARGLAEAHELGIIHRDIKPENVFITHAGEERDLVKVLDFGIAKVSSSVGDASLTRTGTIFGTPTYLSPEAARGQPITPASDVYGVGSLLYLMLTGRPPFTGETPAQLLLAHAEQVAPDMASKVDFAIRPELETLVRRCLRKNPYERFRDAGKLAAELSELRKQAF